MGRELSDTSRVIEKSKAELQTVLKNKWDALLWEPETNNQNRKVTGLEIHRFEHSLYAYVESAGKIILVDEEKSESSEMGVSGYLSLAVEGEQKLDQLYNDQLQELENDPNGREVVWRPGQYRFGRYRSPYHPFRDSSVRTDVIKVRAKKDGLYCPTHTDTPLITVVASTQDLDKFSDCPKEDCRFSVYIGT